MEKLNDSLFDTLFWELCEETNNKEHEEILKILEDDSYMQWLERYTQTRTKFNSNSATHKKRDAKVHENVLKLRYLFEAVDRYAERNSIAETPDSCGYHYIIAFNNNFYMIGITITHDTTFYCARGNFDADAVVIPFENLTLEYENPNREEIEESFDEMFKLIEHLVYTLDVPKETIIKKMKRKISQITT